MDSHWIQWGSGSGILGQCGSGSRSIIQGVLMIKNSIMKNFQCIGETFSHQKRTSRTSKHKTLYPTVHLLSIFVGHFCLLAFRRAKAMPMRIHADPDSDPQHWSNRKKEYQAFWSFHLYCIGYRTVPRYRYLSYSVRFVVIGKIYRCTLHIP